MAIGPECIHRILNLGAGVQSTTVYLMYLRGEIQPGIECAIFADTGEEPASVYTHLQWLQSLGGPPIVVRGIGSRLGEDLKHGQNSTGQRFASIPAFTATGEGKQVGIIRRQCTYEYKVRVIERFIRWELLGLKKRQRIPANTVVHQAYGISLDEAGRSRRIRDRLEDSPWTLTAAQIAANIAAQINASDPVCSATTTGVSGNHIIVSLRYGQVGPVTVSSTDG